MEDKMLKLAAIWMMDRTYTVEDESNNIVSTKRIALGYHLRVKDGEITDITDEGRLGTVLDLEGTIDSKVLTMQVIFDDLSIANLKIKGQ